MPRVHRTHPQSTTPGDHAGSCPRPWWPQAFSAWSVGLGVTYLLLLGVSTWAGANRLATTPPGNDTRAGQAPPTHAGAGQALRPTDTAVVPCNFKRLTGTPCPTCGTTRMLFAVAGGDWASALRSNPLMFVVCCVALIALLVRWLGRRRLRCGALIGDPRMAALLVAAVVVNWFYVIMSGM